jgi:hypothetical protein
MPLLKKYFVLLVVCMAAALFSGCSDEPDITSPFLKLDDTTKAWIATPTNSPELELSGEVSEGGTIEVVVSPIPASDEVSLGPVAITDTIWQYPLSNLNLEGNRTYTVSVTAINALGNRSTLFLSFTVKTTTDVTIDQFITPTPTGSQIVAGTVEPGSELEIMVYEIVEEIEIPVEVTVDENLFVNVMTWEFSLPELEVGEYKIAARATDAIGNIKEEEIPLRVDEAALPLTVESESPTNSREQTITVETAEEVVELKVELNRGEIAPENSELIFAEIPPIEGTRDYQLEALSIGKNILKVSAALGEQTTVAHVMIFVDQTRPSISARIPEGEVDTLPTEISATFSEEMREETLTAETFTVSTASEQPVTGTVSYDRKEKKVVFTPLAVLVPGTTYRVKIDHEVVTDRAGNLLSTVPVLPQWNFTISESPE